VGVTEATSEDTHQIAAALRDSGLCALPAAVRIEALTGLARGRPRASRTMATSSRSPSAVASRWR
jgi:hypothetical protein